LFDDGSGQDVEAFAGQLTIFLQELAQLIVRDGEGATKFVTVRVVNAASQVQAKKVAETIANSSLVKTALYGQDANWGRILSAVGYAHPEPEVNPEKVSVSFLPPHEGERVKSGRPCEGELQVLVRGEPKEADEVAVSELLKEEEIVIRVDLGMGHAEARVWTCDLSKEYVSINADYRS